MVKYSDSDTLLGNEKGLITYVHNSMGEACLCQVKKPDTQDNMCCVILFL